MAQITTSTGINQIKQILSLIKNIKPAYIKHSQSHPIKIILLCISYKNTNLDFALPGQMKAKAMWLLFSGQTLLVWTASNSTIPFMAKKCEEHKDLRECIYVRNKSASKQEQQLAVRLLFS